MPSRQRQPRWSKLWQALTSLKHGFVLPVELVNEEQARSLQSVIHFHSRTSGTKYSAQRRGTTVYIRRLEEDEWDELSSPGISSAQFPLNHGGHVDPTPTLDEYDGVLGDDENSR